MKATEICLLCGGDGDPKFKYFFNGFSSRLNFELKNKNYGVPTPQFFFSGISAFDCTNFGVNRPRTLVRICRRRQPPRAFAVGLFYRISLSVLDCSVQFGPCKRSRAWELLSSPRAQSFSLFRPRPACDSPENRRATRKTYCPFFTPSFSP